MLAPPIPVPATSMRPMPTATSLRYSRRSACDRCRAYKLRCQRDERFGKPCERCAKSRLACTTTFDPATSSASLSSAASSAASSSACQSSRPNPVPHGQTQQQNGNGQIHVGPREQQALLPSRERLHSPPDQRDRRHSSFAHSQREPDNGHFQRQGEAPPESTDMGRNDNTSADSILLDSNSLVLDPMDFALPHMAFDTNDLGLLMVDHSPTRAEGHEDDATLCGPGPGTNLGWGFHGAHPDACMDTGREHRDVEPDMMGAPVDTKRLTGTYKDLLKLSLELVEEREILDTQAPLTALPSIAPLTCSSIKQQQPINRVLIQTARFWDIVKAMASASQESCAISSASSGCGSASGGSGSQTRSNSTSSSSFSQGNLSSLRHVRDTASLSSNGDLDSNFSGSSLSSLPTSAAGRQDHLLMINLVTTYVNLLRNCRAVFTRLYHALQINPSPESNAMLSLPSLQFGEFQLENNVSIQVRVLIELTSGMLQRIGNALGINTGPGLNGPLSPDDQNYRLPFLNDPVAMSTHEIILSQESMQGGIHGGDPPLADIMNNLKRLLESR
ncbi:hypothetical protein C8A01DRAFT_38485 [Parachaetomium inaequale]|uniref:Zn(2)-C6 fungal-type domain-containing protein n=1 Tax=Parachaetomium inaequale TaxID=2588326 RepID=A0AAN6PCM6_9PEZI|nr:hypothetical protein C8A01DRAFT_38485 [Parachaetomium inaequale]